MKITKNGLYKLSEIKENPIIIQDNLSVVLFDDGNLSRKIEIGSNCKVEIYGFLSSITKHNFDTKITGENSTLKIGFLLLSGNKEKLNSRIYSEIGANYSRVDMKIISIVGNNQKINLDGILKINAGLKLVNGNLEEENLFLGDTGIINCIPSLLVSSDRVEASHSCKIERIQDEKIFYLRSRGISKNNATYMMLESYIKTLFKSLEMLNQEFYNKIISSVLKEIEQKI